MTSIPKQVLQGLKQVTVETGKELVEETGKIAGGVVSTKEWLGDIKTMSDEEMNKKKQEEEKKKQEELTRLRQGFGGQGRNVGQEIEQVRKENEKVADEEKKAEQQAVLQQQQQASQQPVMETVSNNPAKQKKSRGSAFAGGKKKKSQPDMQQMSQTSEFKGKIDN